MNFEKIEKLVCSKKIQEMRKYYLKIYHWSRKVLEMVPDDEIKYLCVNFNMQPEVFFSRAFDKNATLVTFYDESEKDFNFSIDLPFMEELEINFANGQISFYIFQLDYSEQIFKEIFYGKIVEFDYMDHVTVFMKHLDSIEAFL